MTRDFRKYQKPEEAPDLTKPAPASSGQKTKFKYWSKSQSLDDIRRIYVKKNYHRFHTIFKNCDAQGKIQISISIYAFFFNVLWFFYRKMYWEGLLLIGALIFLATIETSLNLDEAALDIITLGLIGIFAVLAKGLYWKAVNRQITQAMTLFPTEPDRALQWLARTGGVNYWVMSIGILFFILMFQASFTVASHY